MKSAILTLLASAGGALVNAQGYLIPSNPFRLVLRSINGTLDGTELNACHQGAATEGVCVDTERIYSGSTFFHNTSIYHSKPSNPDASLTPGILYSMASNMANPLFSPGNSSYDAVYFDEGEAMYLPRYYDDTRTPPVYLTAVVRVENWCVCLTKINYLRETVVWKIRVRGVPQNPTCQKVRV
ncbi:hypothetical protein K458DRAFT_428247 [Lentithecium fluviatile CBS 122367]|uniref:DUF7907 domain-containing protein n=1 Tax=Lentithecium fluviatile CBS 122367 TaxID=1168545 RepID=A0A6G1JF18_9PLEO|nr:hypothetical protein K458DRAFT_428247 [Lentithecium fluviatile CBS 122367]